MTLKIRAVTTYEVKLVILSVTEIGIRSVGSSPGYTLGSFCSASGGSLSRLALLVERLPGWYGGH